MEHTVEQDTLRSGGHGRLGLKWPQIMYKRELCESSQCEAFEMPELRTEYFNSCCKRAALRRGQLTVLSFVETGKAGEGSSGLRLCHWFAVHLTTFYVLKKTLRTFKQNHFEVEQEAVVVVGL
jgi:hypothetical protein